RKGCRTSTTLLRGERRSRAELSPRPKGRGQVVTRRSTFEQDRQQPRRRIRRCALLEVLAERAEREPGGEAAVHVLAHAVLECRDGDRLVRVRILEVRLPAAKLAIRMQ